MASNPHEPLYELKWSNQAQTFLRKLKQASESEHQALLEAIYDLAFDPFGPDTIPMRAFEHQRRLRYEQWRVIYIVLKAEKQVLIDLIDVRGQIYSRHGYER